MTDTYAPPPPPAPPPPGQTFDFGRPFTFVFEDPNWLPKVLLGGLFVLLSFILVGVFFIYGYLAQLARNVVDRKERPLPEWDTLGEYFAEGLMLFCITLLYALPVIVVSVGIGIPAAFLDAIHHEGMRSLGGGFIGCLGCVLVPLSMTVFFFLPAGLLMSVMTRRFGAAFELGRLWELIRENIANYLLAIVVFILARFIAGVAGFFLLCIGGIFTSFWAMLVSTYAFAQIYRIAGRR